MDDRLIDKRLRREFRTPGWLLVAYYALMNIMVMIGMFGDMLKQTMAAMAKGEWLTMPDMDALMGNAWGYICAVAVAMLSVEGP